MFTVEVEKKNKDEKFMLKDIGLFHQECFGGNIGFDLEQTNPPSLSWWAVIIRCKRCQNSVCLSPSLNQEIKMAIVRVAVVGEKKSFQDRGGGEVIFVQK